MGGGHPMGLIGFLVISVLLIVPFWKLLPRFGIPSWVALAAIIPLGAIVLLWVMAFRDKLGGQGRF
ncbi:hypothetical protein H0I76_01110 [Limibaculum sp. M0105]|uniref:Uncharacterized protein n=2 Tax=Thermohalobaculum xanthum TaxID=2753746 RepID=A0A8J7M408_9RHOB|nr:hypothetical protein [Thermohalobaculum xanthum]